MSKLKQLKSFFTEVMDFGSRVWVVSVQAGKGKGESYIVNEDSFSEPLSWMKRKGFDESMLARVEKMNRSQTMDFELKDITYRLLRVK
ncbi:hypothetical protein JCM19231_116 [Vibrio ishigakensis]|uniref:Uncharacterized protein n=1 Tax=Vibrio ishigakensis TaxID=1481914 RepID=A0A0B8P8C4_9VIBR|nr:hypothetical protein [Vibrio ishigakensis]GAM59443.1 hypothetical protein JCM19231_116 [Vibrio ishigakensis]